MSYKRARKLTKSKSVHLLDHEVPLEDAGENGGENLLAEAVDGEGVEVTEEARRDRVPSSTRRSHRRQDLDVHESDHGAVREVVPVPVVVPLSQQLDRRLGAVLLPHRHVDVIHEHHLQLYGIKTS